MSLEGIVAGTAVGIVVGVVSAVVTHKTLCDVDAKVREEDRAEIAHASYNNGWTDASNNANNVRQAFTRLFGSADEEAGVTIKTSKKG